MYKSHKYHELLVCYLNYEYCGVLAETKNCGGRETAR
jgi:hypothetical protein